MKKQLALLGLMLLTACSSGGDTASQNTDTQSGSTSDSWMIDNSNPSNAETANIPGTGGTMQGESVPAGQIQSASYLAFTDSALTDGKPKVLFFHAAWCPVCIAADTQLTAWYGAQQPTIDTYKVDYDTQSALKDKYGVSYQHTFVLVDGEGNMVQKVQGPSETALQALIGV